MDYINDNELTIVIKTFQRKKALVCLLESIKKYYFHVPLIIVDDSKKTYKKEIISLFSDLKITYIVTDFDIGLSKGRNIGINAVRSKYFLLCDDDFEFDERTNIGRAIKILEEEKFDIVGGRLFEKYRINSLFSFLTILKHPKRIFDFFSNVEISRVFNGFLEINSSSVVARIETNGNLYEEGIEKYSFDIISNFFIARTNKIKEMQGWLPENIKVGEHVLFL